MKLLFSSRIYNVFACRRHREQESTKALLLHRSLQRNYYEILGISQDATLAQLKSAYYRKSKELHPDNASDLDEAEAARRQKEFVELNKAYETLRRASTRKEYDAVLGEEYNHIHINVHNYGRNATEWHQFRFLFTRQKVFPHNAFPNHDAMSMKKHGINYDTVDNAGYILPYHKKFYSPSKATPTEGIGIESNEEVAKRWLEAIDSHES
ncbi:unnamed protein product [Enterobius vermicularis]|uniref:J domain-containing protein n=1 Tax=Enterobius vermicularis TaxID=51028 RepID=A0A0N4UVW8_ENTVE|nr:unnamed protein product [Enterobius vermicularis]